MTSRSSPQAVLVRSTQSRWRASSASHGSSCRERRDSPRRWASSPSICATIFSDPAELAQAFAGLQAEAHQILDAESIHADRQVVELSVDVRYYGQTPYMNLPVSRAPQT